MLMSNVMNITDTVSSYKMQSFASKCYNNIEPACFETPYRTRNLSLRIELHTPDQSISSLITLVTLPSFLMLF